MTTQTLAVTLSGFRKSPSGSRENQVFIRLVGCAEQVAIALLFLAVDLQLPKGERG